MNYLKKTAIYFFLVMMCMAEMACNTGGHKMQPLEDSTTIKDTVSIQESKPVKDTTTKKRSTYIEDTTSVKVPTHLKAKRQELKEHYANAKSGNKEDRIKFFKVFPSTFSLFDSIYGFVYETEVLYNYSIDHIGLFCELNNTLPEETYYRKLVGLGINGHWDADGVTYLQMCIENHVKEDLPLMVSTLEEYSDEEIESFWYYLFDGPHPSETIPVDIDSIRKVNVKIAKLVEEAFHHVHADSEPHGH